MSKHSIITIGVFDGVHRGHTAVIKKVVEKARKKHLQSIAVTFDPHPMKVLSGRQNVPSLISLKHRIRLIKELGIDKVIVMKFDKKLACMPAEKFIKNIIVNSLQAKEVFVGEDFCFGKGAKTGVTKLKEIGVQYSLKVNIIKHVKLGSRIVSSSLIRKLVVDGHIKEASHLLGRPYSVLGTVVGGSKLARSLGYPTANLNPHHEAVPPSGVYAVKVRFMGRLYRGVMNIGVRPTFYEGRDKEPSIEVHIFNFHKRIYGKDLESIFVKRLRNEKKFKTIDSLIKQIKKDEAAAQKLLLYK